MLFSFLLFPVGRAVGQDCDENKVFPDPNQCDKYWECRGGNLTSHLCPDGLVYDLTTSVASFQVGKRRPDHKLPLSRWAQGRPQAMAAGAVTRSPSTAQVVHSSSRLSLGTIVRGRTDISQLLVLAISIGSVEATNQQQSMFARSPLCLPQIRAGETCSQKPSALNFCRCTWKGEANRPECEEADTFHEDFLCPESGFGEYLRYPDPADCRAYYVCVQGSASRSICPAGQAFHPTSVACSEEDNLPPGLCAPGKLWEDRNSTGSGAPTITIPKTRTRQPVSGVFAFAIFCASNTTFQITSTLT